MLSMHLSGLGVIIRIVISDRRFIEVQQQWLCQGQSLIHHHYPICGSRYFGEL
jgi:hypothetical protein